MQCFLVVLEVTFKPVEFVLNELGFAFTRLFELSARAEAVAPRF